MSSKTIIFHENSLGLRGTTVAIYDYALYCEEILGLNTIISFDLKNQTNKQVLQKFKKRFRTVSYFNFNEVQQLVDKNNIEYFYTQKFGYQDNIIVQNTKNLIHSVFVHNANYKHGEVYAVTSEWMKIQSGNQLPYVPYMVNFPETNLDIRNELGIPNDAIVLGRYGGYETFNVNFVPSTIEKILDIRTDMWIVLVNTEKTIKHERCIYLNSLVELEDKSKFINTCDAFLHARDYGETFGMAVLEFASKNKQILSYDNEELQTTHPLGGRAHFLHLKDNVHKYRNKLELEYILLNLEKTNPFNTEYLNQEFSPKNVIYTFEKVFLNNEN